MQESRKCKGGMGVYILPPIFCSCKDCFIDAFLISVQALHSLELLKHAVLIIAVDFPDNSWDLWLSLWHAGQPIVCERFAEGPEQALEIKHGSGLDLG